MNSIFKFKPGFTMVELMVVVAMLAILMSSMTVSVSSARRRASINKATSEVKVISQTVLAYENFTKKGLPTLSDVEVDESSLGFLFGNGGEAEEGGQQLVLLQGSLRSGKMRDPWGTPYRVRITQGEVKVPGAMGQLRTGFMLPNIDRLSKEER